MAVLYGLLNIKYKSTILSKFRVNSIETRGIRADILHNGHFLSGVGFPIAFYEDLNLVP